MRDFLQQKPDSLAAPVRIRGGVPTQEQWPRPWEGHLAKKPWDYRVTAAIVHIDTPDLLALVLDTLRAQTEQPYLVVIDTGSLDHHAARLRRMEAESEDLEIHFLRPRGWRVSSEVVAAAMDVAFAVCHTEYLYSTHVDVFLKRPDFLAYLLGRCDLKTPAVGYQMSERVWWHSDLWRQILSHTASIYHMPTMRRLQLSWSMQATFEHLGMPMVQPEERRDPRLPVQPDTEVNLGLGLMRAGVGQRWLSDPDPGPHDPPSVLFLGSELNEPYETPWLEHVRSTTGRQMYDKGGAARQAARLALAVAQTRARIEEWRGLRVLRPAVLRTAEEAVQKEKIEQG